MLTHIKNWSYNKKIQQRRSTIKAPSLDPVNPGKMVGILFELEKLDDHSVVKSIKQQLAKQGRVVKSLSYIDQKIDIENFSQRAFSKKELKWNGIPQTHFVEEFLLWEFDLLICPLKIMRPCYEYIIQLSPAKLKVGLNTEYSQHLFDLIIDIPGQKELSDIFDEIFNQLKVVSH